MEDMGRLSGAGRSLCHKNFLLILILKLKIFININIIFLDLCSTWVSGEQDLLGIPKLDNCCLGLT